jgi:hypothetical protein
MTKELDDLCYFGRTLLHKFKPDVSHACGQPIRHVLAALLCLTAKHRVTTSHIGNDRMRPPIAVT